MCTIQLWKLDVTLDIRSNLVWIYLILCYPVSRHSLLDIEVILPFLQRWNIFTNDHKGAPLFISLYFYSFFFLSECFIKIRNMLCATISFPGNLEEPHLVWVPWRHNLPSLCFHPAYGCMWPYLYACRNVFILEYFKVITDEALDTVKWMAKLRLTSIRLQFRSTRNRDHFIYYWKAAFNSLLCWDNKWKINAGTI